MRQEFELLKKAVDEIHARVKPDLTAAVVEYFQGGGAPDDDSFHAHFEKQGADVSAAESAVYGLLKSFLTGGKSKGEKRDVDQAELSAGIDVEQEHTDNKLLAEKISRDHLVEDPLYYQHLAEMEKKYKAGL